MSGMPDMTPTSLTEAVAPRTGKIINTDSIDGNQILQEFNLAYLQ